MTLPRGFGNNNGYPYDRKSPNCEICGEPVLKNRKTKKWECPDCEPNTDIKIPIKKEDLGIYGFYIAFYGGIIGVLTMTFTGALIGFISMFVSFFVGMFMTGDIGWNDERMWKVRKRMFPWAVPIANFIKRIRFEND